MTPEEHLEQVVARVDVVAEAWDTHRVECSQRDSENRGRFEEIRGDLADGKEQFKRINEALDVIAPWAKSAIAREEQRRQFWERIHAIAVAEGTAIFVKGMGWLVAGIVALWLRHTELGTAIVRSLTQ